MQNRVVVHSIECGAVGNIDVVYTNRQGNLGLSLYGSTGTPSVGELKGAPINCPFASDETRSVAGFLVCGACKFSKSTFVME